MKKTTIATLNNHFESLVSATVTSRLMGACVKSKREATTVALFADLSGTGKSASEKDIMAVYSATDKIVAELQNRLGFSAQTAQTLRRNAESSINQYLELWCTGTTFKVTKGTAKISKIDTEAEIKAKQIKAIKAYNRALEILAELGVLEYDAQAFIAAQKEKEVKTTKIESGQSVAQKLEQIKKNELAIAQSFLQAM